MINPLLHHHIFETIFGFAAIVFKEDNSSVKRIFLPSNSKAASEKLLKETHSSSPGHTPKILKLSSNIQAYFNGTPISLSMESIDLSKLSDLEQLVLKTVATIKYGTTQTYGQISEQIGRSRAYRFVGTTLAKNPFPLVIPCHRIVRADGSPGGFAGGTTLKERMLEMEKQHCELRSGECHETIK